MHYTIAMMKDVQIDMVISFDKVGNKYLVGLRNSENNEYTKKLFDNFREAKETYMKLADAILEGCYSYNQRKSFLK